MAAEMVLWLKSCGRTSWRWAILFRQLIVPQTFPGGKAYLLRCLLGLIALPLLAAIQLCNASGLLLDELLFRGYRQQRLRRPVFILGVPRSGTTHTHHVLSVDKRFTTVTLWEALFAPSVSQRYLVAGLACLDCRMGGPGARLLRMLERRLQGSLKEVHPTGLGSPEEDFLLLLSSLDCFLLVLAFPECDWLWQLAQGDRESHKRDTGRVMKRYRSLLQRHAHFHGSHLQLLSKNASFAGLGQTLAETFPDCVLIVCERDAVLAARSQLRSLAAVRQQLFTDRVCPDFEACLLDTLHGYYRNLDHLKRRLPSERWVSLPLWRLSRQPRQAMLSIYEQLSLGSIEPLEGVLCALEAAEPARPGTHEPSGKAVIATARPFERFEPWRHIPENRL